MLYSIGTYYRTTSASDDLDLLFNVFTFLNLSILSNLIVLGDFNIKFYFTSSSKTKQDVISDDTFDNVPTHFSQADTLSTIDLLFSRLTLMPLLVISFLLSLLQTISLLCSLRLNLQSCLLYSYDTTSVSDVISSYHAPQYSFQYITSFLPHFQFFPL